MSQEVEEILKRIQSHKGVVGTIVVNNEARQDLRVLKSSVLAERPKRLVSELTKTLFIEADVWRKCQSPAEGRLIGEALVTEAGIPVKSTLDNTTTVQYAGLMSQLADKARSVVRDLDPSNDLTFLRVRSKKHEIMVAPDKDFILIVIQNPTD